MAALFCSLSLCSLQLFSQNLTGTVQESKPFVKEMGIVNSRIALAVDMNQLPGIFEKGYLLDLIFADSRMVIEQTSISSEFMQVNLNEGADKIVIIKTLNEYRQKSLDAGQSFPASEKEKLVQKYSKYQ